MLCTHSLAASVWLEGLPAAAVLFCCIHSSKCGGMHAGKRARSRLLTPSGADVLNRKPSADHLSASLSKRLSQTLFESWW